MALTSPLTIKCHNFVVGATTVTNIHCPSPLHRPLRPLTPPSRPLRLRYCVTAPTVCVCVRPTGPPSVSPGSGDHRGEPKGQNTVCAVFRDPLSERLTPAQTTHCSSSGQPFIPLSSGTLRGGFKVQLLVLKTGVLLLSTEVNSHSEVNNSPCLLRGKYIYRQFCDDCPAINCNYIYYIII